jgi:hypothetical protein
MLKEPMRIQGALFPASKFSCLLGAASAANQLWRELLNSAGCVEYVSGVRGEAEHGTEGKSIRTPLYKPSSGKLH